MQAAYNRTIVCRESKLENAHSGSNLCIFVMNGLLVDLTGGKKIANDDHRWKISSPNVPDWTGAVTHLGWGNEV